MKANKETLMAVKGFLENRDGWSLDELIEEMVAETKLLQDKDMDFTIATDECGIEWGGEDICLLSNFVDSYSKIFIEKFCNILESFVDEDLSYYEYY